MGVGAGCSSSFPRGGQFKSQIPPAQYIFKGGGGLSNPMPLPMESPFPQRIVGLP